MKNSYLYHYFFDEAGDTSFYGKNRKNIVGSEGVSHTFLLGMLSFKTPLSEIRSQILDLQKQIGDSPYYKNVPSVKNRVLKNGFFFHAKDDLPEIRKEFFDLILKFDCSFQAVVGRKIVSIFENKHHNKEKEFYADLLSHLLKDKLHKYPHMLLNIAERGSSTALHNLETGLAKAKHHHRKKFAEGRTVTKVIFNVENYQSEPLLAVVDYLCWAVQRVFEKGETRFYDYVCSKIGLVVDLYDRQNYEQWKNYYTSENPLTEKNKVSPQLP